MSEQKIERPVGRPRKRDPVVGAAVLTLFRTRDIAALADWIEQVGVDVALATMRETAALKCKQLGCGELRVNANFCEACRVAHNAINLQSQRKYAQRRKDARKAAKAAK